MPASALGVKRSCQECNAKYYDLNKQPITCPKCGTVFDPEIVLKSRRVKPTLQNNDKENENKEAESVIVDELEIADDVDVDVDVGVGVVGDDGDLLGDETGLLGIKAANDDEDDITAAEVTIKDDLEEVEETEIDE